MFSLGPITATCRVFTFREGVLSKFGHDLAFEVPHFSVDVRDDGTVDGTFDLRGLRVLGAVHASEVVPLSVGDAATIEKATQGDVLHTKRNPTTSLKGTFDRATGKFSGTHTLSGVEQPLRIDVSDARRDGDTARLSVTLQPSKYGIAPYKAMLGALKLRDHVVVELTFPAEVLVRELAPKQS